jgi:hypothetical protein
MEEMEEKYLGLVTEEVDRCIVGGKVVGYTAEED